MTHQICRKGYEVEQEDDPGNELLSTQQRIYSQRREAWPQTE